ncbi:peptidase M16 [Pueribacillus theae]|uniref:Peptidase M16 n=1 Tax=Pueribacillus theae TaxID=2171751 RepID=A0A2U1K895_9BACI|nr:pitrilysin family protein [Pueribacillus theae]PWA13564.1 peptidase M16 [Pueribacillus theae]
MKQITFNHVGETVYEQKLPNGLHVVILPKQGFNKTYATFTTKYGSIDNQFTPKGKKEKVRVPDGIAHFLEHKLFEKEDGDVFHDFSKQGASANAFTSFTRTAYLFSTTQDVKKNLITLLDFVQSPYFTEQTVEKEKGIIGQEIRMYDDNPDWRAYYGVIENMYHNHPVKIDIAGTVESISHITKDLLYECYETFYHPSNMLLFIIGPVNPNEIMALIEENQANKTFKQETELKRFFDEEPKHVAEKEKIIPMHINTPKCIVGFKEQQVGRQGNELLKHELAMNVLMDLMFGQSSNNYETLYDEGLIDQSFFYDYSEEESFGFSVIGSNTDKPKELAHKLFDMVNQFRTHPLNEEDFLRIKKKKIGSILRSFNSLEYIANEYTRYQFNGMNLFDTTKVLESLTMEDIEEVLQQHFVEDAFTVCQIVPKT